MKKNLLLLTKIAAESGILTNLVKSQIKPEETASNFKDQFLSSKIGPSREQLIFNEVTKRGINKTLVPITVPGPNNTKITYKVMPDYITIDGIRVPMSGQTAQKVADYFNMVLPTPKMSKQIYDAADTKILAAPLSSGGKINGKYYSGEEVVSHKIGDSDSSVAYNQMIDDKIKETKSTPTLIAGHMKDIVQPENPDKLGLYGWYNNGKAIQNSHQTPHDTIAHTEYGAGTRLIDSGVEITMPDGSVVKTTMDKLMSDPNLRKSVSDYDQVKRYTI